MSKTKKLPKSKDAGPKLSDRLADPAAAQPTYAVRETVESIVIAFVLAFLFRTFEAEAFVIPTGSMAPTLMGLHKDVDCPKCGHRYRVTSSEEGEETESKRADIRKVQADAAAGRITAWESQAAIDKLRKDIQGLEIVGGNCPVCRYTMPMRPNLPPALVDDAANAELQRSYNGDRILVNKYLYTVTDPRRWDVVVFHFPGNAEQNYIKRLVGLPNETLRIYQGDLYTKGPEDDAYKIARKPPDKVLAVRQLVHDTDYDPAELFDAGWPLRWQVTQTDPDGWQLESPPKVVEGNVRQRYTIDRTRGGEAWLQYHHNVPEYDDWQQAAAFRAQAVDGEPAKPPAKFERADKRQLIMDFNAYNTRVKRAELDAQSALKPDRAKLGLHWVGDLTIEADVEVESAQGELLLELVEGGKLFTCRIDLATGQATLLAAGQPDFAPTAKTPVGAGHFHVAFANVDDQLLLWIDGGLIEFDKPTIYDVTQVFGDRGRIRPQDDDLHPARIGARGAKLAVTRLQVWRDIYYIADSAAERRDRSDGTIADYDRPNSDRFKELRFKPALWEMVNLRSVEFPLGDDKFFVMGDNSPESSDARLWTDGRQVDQGGMFRIINQPGGAYLERKLLIGKAVVVYWPHGWYSIPFTRIPIWPNFKDMRLVR